MSDYQIKAAAAFDTYPGAAGQQGPLSGHLLLRITDTGRSEEHYRLVATGDGDLKHTFRVAEIAAAARVAHYSLSVEVAPDELLFKPNSTVSKWENLDDLVASERVRASLDDDGDADDDFRAAWAAAKDDGDHAAGTWQAGNSAAPGASGSSQAAARTDTCSTPASVPAVSASARTRGRCRSVPLPASSTSSGAGEDDTTR